MILKAFGQHQQILLVLRTYATEKVKQCLFIRK